MKKQRVIAGFIALAAAAVLAAALAEPPSERTLVAAVADASSPRILVRWRADEGSARFTFYDVLRRLPGEGAFTQLNAEPIGPLTNAVAIGEVFTPLARADALAAIQSSFGTDYANDILALQAPGAPSEARLQRRLLPEQNYGAALSLGTGFMDESAVLGQTYVYEVWGLDAAGTRIERLGRATATSGTRDPLPPPRDLTCAAMGGAQGDLAVGLRWEEPGAIAPFFGYDVLRKKAQPDGNCPASMAGAVQVNVFPVLRTTPGRAARGEALFAASCAVCHAPAGRDDPLIKRSTRRDFRREQYIDCDGRTHDTAALNALTPEDLSAIYDFIHAFHFQDDGETVPAEPLSAKDRYCYQVFARDLLGKRGDGSAVANCGVPDRLPPPVPQQIDAQRVYDAPSELEGCTITWRPNPAPSGTARYRVFRFQAPHAPRTFCDAAGAMEVGVVASAACGARCTHSDPGTAVLAGTPYFYAVRAEDDAGFDEDRDGTSELNNRSGFSGWVPCTPRDRRAPGASTIDVACPSPSQCQPPADCIDYGDAADPRTAWWRGQGGAPLVVGNPASPDCKPRIEIDSAPDDTFQERLQVQLAGDDAPRSGADFPVGTSTLDFAPQLDTRLCVSTRGMDRSGNLAPLSNEECAVLEGRRPPAPRIVSYAVLNVTTGQVRIRFRALAPRDLIAFALYLSDAEVAPPLLDTQRGSPVDSFPRGNVSAGTDPDDIALHAVYPATQSLEDYGTWNDPGISESLTYLGDFVWELVTHLDFVDDVRLWLAGVGWSGHEGEAEPYIGRIPAFTLADGQLDWPEFVDHNSSGAPLGASALTVVANGGGNRIELSWSPFPACVCGENPKPAFSVFRRRQGRQTWEQISPLFTCDYQNCPAVPPPAPIVFFDKDVESGFFYKYRVVRLDGHGEFRFEHVQTTAICYPNAGGCIGAAPE